MRLLQVSAEIFPLLKTGGLADIAGALPAALQEAGCEVRVLLPGFPAIRAGIADAVAIGSFVTPWGASVQVEFGVLPALSTTMHRVYGYVLVAPELYDRPGNPYEDANKQPYADNCRRFAALGWAAAHLAHGLDRLWRPELVHAHDWHAGLAPACLAHWNGGQGPYVPSVFTIHNLAYQGVFGAQHFGELGLPPFAFNVQGVEYYGQLSFIKSGSHIRHPHHHRQSYLCPGNSDAGAGVWPRRIVARPRRRPQRHPECGRCGRLGPRQRRAAEATPYSIRNLTGKAVNKAELQAAMGLAVQSEAPLFAMVSRLTEQKGVPLVIAASTKSSRAVANC